jgi:hypothetical protein
VVMAIAILSLRSFFFSLFVYSQFALGCVYLCVHVSIYIGSCHHSGCLLGNFFHCARSKFFLGNYYSVRPSLTQTPLCNFEQIVSFYLSYVVRRCWLVKSSSIGICSKTKEVFFCKFLTFFHCFFLLLCMHQCEY